MEYINQRLRMKKILLIVVIIIFTAGTGFTIWGLTPQGPLPEVIPYLKSSQTVTVVTSPWLTFTPQNNPSMTGFIFYPGGHVNYKSYAPAAYRLAEKGAMVVIVPMPLNLAVLNPDAASQVIKAYPAIKYWVLGGHSLGGAMAAYYAYQNPGQVSGLVLWAGYPAQSNNLSKSTFPVISIYGSLDGLATGEKLQSTKSLLPPDTKFVEINGGNHAQMGYYGNQAGDHSAAISREEQQSILVDTTWNFIKGLE
jgi:triacylglycerol esterase/lipase EstA (alpha/beta hydrolase family)